MEVFISYKLTSKLIPIWPTNQFAVRAAEEMRVEMLVDVVGHARGCEDAALVAVRRLVQALLEVLRAADEERHLQR